jgi:hypothetical protein
LLQAGADSPLYRPSDLLFCTHAGPT